jgi:hemerythrin
MIARTTMPLSIRQHFLADHVRLETVLEELIRAFEANDREDVAALWAELDSGLLAHLEAEETYMIPALLAFSEREARVIIGEHKHIRARLIELGAGIDLHIVRLESARDFVEELRAHARNEDRLLYRWVDDHLSEREREALLAPPRARLPLPAS